jgi:hypothetical protein
MTNNLLGIDERESHGRDDYDFGGLERHPCNILRLISELEGSYQLCKFMGFEEDMKILDEMKKPYYKLYFKTKKEYDSK